MYDSFLYGYGLTLAISNKLSKFSALAPQQKKILYFDSFFHTFVTSVDHKRIYRQFLKLYKVDSGKVDLHKQMKNNLASRMEEINKYGVEKWVGKNLFDPNSEVSSEEKMYLYFLYGYWAHLVYVEILHLPNIQKLLDDTAREIQRKIKSDKNIFTTNFDTLLDKYLHPHHLHGTIPAPLKNVDQIIFRIFPNKKDLEYSFLFGANGIEKLTRLNEIHKLTQNKYQLDFFYNLELDLGHLLIYGLSFGKTAFITDEFLEKYPKYENDYYFRSVDGHILLKLNERYQKGLLSKVTVSYYTSQDLEHLRYFFSMTDFISIVEFIPANDIFQI